MALPDMDLSAGAKLSPEPCEGECGKYFVYYPASLPQDTVPRRCSRCQDIAQGRPSVAETRKEVAFYEAVQVINLPATKWEEYQTGVAEDYPRYRMDIRGRVFGASWNGRIVIYADHSVVAGQVVNIREMEVTHQVKVKTVLRQTLEHGTVTVEHEFPVTGDEGEKALRTRRYFVLEAAEPGTEPKARLVWATAYTKTTLKGFGRQFWSQITGSPIAEWRISGGVRSGRAHSVGVLAIVDEEHPIVASTTGDHKGEKMYN